MERRYFLKSAVATLALPLLESTAKPQTKARKNAKAKRLVCIGTWLGVHTPSFFPEKTGKNYRPSTLLKTVDRHRSKYTIFSGLDHRCAHGHKSWNNFLCATSTRSVSLDQVIAEQIGQQTRFKSLHLVAAKTPSEAAMNVTKHGVVLPMIERPRVLFDKLFTNGANRERQKYELDSGRSILDDLLAEAKSFNKALSRSDQEKMDQYLSSVREVEKEIQKQRYWLDQPVTVKGGTYKMPKRDPLSSELLFQCERIMLDLTILALETGSTNVCTYLAPGQGVFTINGKLLSAAYHGLSHHGNAPDKIGQFVQVNNEHMKNLDRFLHFMRKRKDEQGRPLLDSTIVYFGSGLGNANIHSTNNVPVLVAGGGFKHGNYFAINRKGHVLGDLFVTMMQQLGINADKFANAKNNMNDFLT